MNNASDSDHEFDLTEQAWEAEQLKLHGPYYDPDDYHDELGLYEQEED